MHLIPYIYDSSMFIVVFLNVIKLSVTLKCYDKFILVS